MLSSKYILILSLCFTTVAAFAQQPVSTQVLVIGGGTGGVAAGLQAARMGVPTIIVEPGPWLGGMISAAGVSATDGNHKLASGIWKEFRERLYKVYGGPHAVATGWVSNTQFEPHVADSIFKRMVAETKNLTVYYDSRFQKVFKTGNKITGAQFIDALNRSFVIESTITIDATEIGDVLANAGAPFDLGMEAGNLTGENVGVHETNDIVQELTYVAILKDYGAAADCTIAKPIGYNPAEFDGACTDYYVNKQLPVPDVDSKKMLDYGRLPHQKYMLNWPKSGNDTYLNIVGMTEAERAKELEKAKETTKRFIYFIQHQLGYKNLGLANDEFPTKDRLALMPYYREGRRVKGLVRYTMRNIAEPFTYGDPLYRTGISVGDYPIDHHHKKNKAAPQQLEFYPIPSFNVPLGALIPQQTEGLIIAEKGISVSNVVNGTTRLQPCVLVTGQAAGALAALSVQQQCAPSAVAVRNVQSALLKSGAYIMPYIDVPYDHPAFAAIQRIGATGILKGNGIPYKWANQTWFYPELPVNQYELVHALQAYYPALRTYKEASGELVNSRALFDVCKQVNTAIDENAWQQDLQKQGIGNHETTLKRSQVAILLDKYLNPFDKPITITGHLQ